MDRKNTLGDRARVAGVIALLVVLFGFTGPVIAAPKYTVSASLVHLGEVVASPVMVVEEGVTTRIHHGEPPHFTMAVLIHPMDDEQVQVSLDYSSGNLSAQPNLVVPIGEPYQTSTEKLLLYLQIDPFEE